MYIQHERNKFYSAGIRPAFRDGLVALLLVGLLYLIGGWWIHRFGSRIPGVEWSPPFKETRFGPRVFHEWREAEGFFQHRGISTLYLGEFKIDVEAAFDGPRSEEVKAPIRRMMDQKEIRTAEIRTEIRDQMGKLGVAVTDRDSVDCDATAEGTFFIRLTGVQFLIFRHGALLGQLNMEIRSSSSKELIALFQILEEEEL